MQGPCARREHREPKGRERPVRLQGREQGQRWAMRRLGRQAGPDCAGLWHVKEASLSELRQKTNTNREA